MNDFYIHYYLILVRYLLFIIIIYHYFDPLFIAFILFIQAMFRCAEHVRDFRSYSKNSNSNNNNNNNNNSRNNNDKNDSENDEDDDDDDGDDDGDGDKSDCEDPTLSRLPPIPSSSSSSSFPPSSFSSVLPLSDIDGGIEFMSEKILDLWILYSSVRGG